MRIIDWSSDVFSSDLFSVMEKPEVVAAIKDCDFIFLAADGHRARRLFNALVHQYLIPGVQIGTRIQVDPNSGAVINVHTTTRPVTPSKGCMLCNQAVSQARLREESISQEMRVGQRYINEDDAPAPRSEEHTSELQSLMRISYAVFCLKKKKKDTYRMHEI